MAVANVATAIANRHGKNVLVIDWDLEAPGLHKYFGLGQGEKREQPGLLDYFEMGRDAFIKLGRDPTLRRLDSPVEIVDFVVSPEGDAVEAIRRGSVSVLTSGVNRASYFTRLGAFDWHAFYSEGGGYWVVDRLRLQAMKQFDIVLIDSAAGRSQTSVLPLLQMPDLVAMLFTSTEQSIEGALSVASALSYSRRSGSFRRTPMDILLIPSRIDQSDQSVVAWTDLRVRDFYGALEREGSIAPSHVVNRRHQVAFCFEPGLPLGERLIALSSRHRQSRLAESYDAMADALSLLASRTGDPDLPQGLS